MKKKIHMFLFLIFLILSLLPFINFNAGRLNSGNWWKLSTLYNMDFLLPIAGKIFYKFGVSIAPDQVIIGKSGWLYLGDQYGASISGKRKELIEDDRIIVNKVLTATSAWEKWYKQHNVEEYRVLVAPDKDTVYPEYLPDWVKPTIHTKFDLLMDNANSDIYVKTAFKLHAAKKIYGIPLYYKTDHHWNSLGGWVAFNELAKSLLRSKPELIFPSEDVINSMRTAPWAGGDLSKFQWIRDYAEDEQVVIDIFNSIQIQQFDFVSGNIIASGNNIELGAPDQPILVKSEKAANKKKVLWLRDSFGSVLSPFMMAAFTDVLQVHYGKANNEFLSLVFEKFKPDYVVITVVERNSFIDYFQSLPPLFSSHSRDSFVSHAIGKNVAINDLTRVDDKSWYSVVGENPYLVFNLSAPISPKISQQLFLEFTCVSGADLVSVKVFWRTKDKDFNEESSVRFNANQGITSINFSTVKTWAASEDIVDIRVDLEPSNRCSKVLFNSLEVGEINS